MQCNTYALQFGELRTCSLQHSKYHWEMTTTHHQRKYIYTSFGYR